MARAHRGRRVGRQSPGRRFSPRAVRRYGRHAPLPSAGRRATTARPCGHSRHHDQDAGRTYRYTPATTGIDRRPTTLLDPAAAPATELAALYHERWEVETAYDEVKTHILGPGALLRSKTPDLVLQEVHGLMLAHYAVRRLIHEAARRVDEDPDRLSFVHAVRVVRRRVENPGVSPLGEQ